MFIRLNVNLLALGIYQCHDEMTFNLVNEFGIVFANNTSIRFYLLLEQVMLQVGIDKCIHYNQKISKSSYFVVCHIRLSLMTPLNLIDQLKL